ESNPVRVIDAFVDALDLAELGFDSVEPAATGRPSYHPSVLLKLYIYGYLNRVQSSRRLEREAGRNLEVMWLLGRLAADHKTIADFRKDNGGAIKKVCVRFVELCRRMGLLLKASVAIDGSMMLGAASICVADEIGKICSETSSSFVALRPRPVKDPAFAFSHDQDPKPTLRTSARCDAASAII